MNRHGQSSVLIIAYRRYENLSRILHICEANAVDTIYIALDGPNPSNPNGLAENSLMQGVISKFSENFKGQVHTLIRRSNVGCAASVLSACDWIFRTEDFAIILEDDCIPTNDFFAFTKRSFLAMKDNDQIWLACGTQFVPNGTEVKPWLLSRYPLTWGWATSKKNWKSISISIRNGHPFEQFNMVVPVEKIYWKEGARRAYEGYVDVWDTVLAHRMNVEKKYAILPKNSLVSNIGNDQMATHTFVSSPWLNIQTGEFGNTDLPPTHSLKIDQWLRKNFYGISTRHYITTKITKLRDAGSRPAHKELVSSWQEANKFFEDI